MIQRMAPAGVTPAAPHHHATLATVLRARSAPAVRAPPLIVAPGPGLGRFGPAPGRPGPSTPRESQHKRDRRWALPLARGLRQRAQERAALGAPGLQGLGEHTPTGQPARPMGLSRGGGARGHRESQGLEAREHCLGRDPAAAMGLAHPLPLLLGPQRGVRRGRGPIQQGPQPGRRSRRAPRQQRRRKPLSLVPSPRGLAPAGCEPRGCRSAALS